MEGEGQKAKAVVGMSSIGGTTSTSMSTSTSASRIVAAIASVLAKSKSIGSGRSTIHQGVKLTSSSSSGHRSRKEKHVVRR
jgi:hypothetical protein